MKHTVKFNAASTATRFGDWLTTPQRTWAASYLRVALGMLAALFFVEHCRQISLLWGPHGQISASDLFQSGARDGLLAILWQSGAGTMFVYSAGFISSIALAFGVFPRAMAVVFVATLYEVYSRNGPILNGGQEIILIIAFYLCFADTSHYFCAIRVRTLERFPTVQRLSAIVHNAAMTMVVVQISLVYFWSAFFKITGHLWQNGTALYYIMRDEWYTSSVSHLFYLNSTVVTLATYGTIALEMAFAFLLWNRRLRLPILCSVLVLHLNIAIFMGLSVFALTMMAIDIGVLTDGDVYRVQNATAKFTRIFSRGSDQASLRTELK